MIETEELVQSDQHIMPLTSGGEMKTHNELNKQIKPQYVN